MDELYGIQYEEYKDAFVDYGRRYISVYVTLSMEM